MAAGAKRVLAGSAIAAAAALVPAAPAAAGPVISCEVGYVCVVAGTATVWLAEGGSAVFPGGLAMTGIANQTKTLYCVAGSPNFGVAPGQEIVRTQTITAVGPSSGACLS